MIVLSTYHITSGNDAVQAETLMEILGGTYELLAGGGNDASVTNTSVIYDVVLKRSCQSNIQNQSKK